MNKEILEFANEASRESATVEVLCFSNEILDAGNGWWKIPYAEIPYGNKIQVFNEKAAQLIVSDFKQRASQFLTKFKRNFELPIFVGHPDNREWCNSNPSRVDDKAYGWVQDMRAEQDAFYYKPSMGEAGSKLLANDHYRGTSPNWLARHIGGNRYLPFQLNSIGLVNKPNIEGSMANEKSNANQSENKMNEMLRMLLAKLGLADYKITAIANEADDAMTLDEVVALANEHIDGKVVVVSELANEKAARESLEAALETKTKALEDAEEAFANERKERIEMVADNAVFRGKIGFAERGHLVTELANDFDGRIQTLNNQPQKFKTEKIDKDFSKETTSKGATIAELANEYMEEHNLDKTNQESHIKAYTHLQKTRKDLFETE